MFTNGYGGVDWYCRQYSIHSVRPFNTHISLTLFWLNFQCELCGCNSIGFRISSSIFDRNGISAWYTLQTPKPKLCLHLTFEYFWKYIPTFVRRSTYRCIAMFVHSNRIYWDFKQINWAYPLPIIFWFTMRKYVGSNHQITKTKQSSSWWTFDNFSRHSDIASICTQNVYFKIIKKNIKKNILNFVEGKKCKTHVLRLHVEADGNFCVFLLNGSVLSFEQ